MKRSSEVSLIDILLDFRQISIYQFGYIPLENIIEFNKERIRTERYDEHLKFHRICTQI